MIPAEEDAEARWSRWERDGEQVLAYYQPLRNGDLACEDLTSQGAELVGRLLAWRYGGVFDEGFTGAGEDKWCCDAEQFAWVPSSHLEFVGSPLQGSPGQLGE